MNTNSSTLTLNKTNYLSQFPSPSGKSYDKLVVGAIIFHPSKTDPGRLLLLKRAPHERFYPNVFEIPGGNVEATDTTILDAVKREVHEETALSIQDVIDTIDSFSYSTEKIVKKDHEDVLVKKIPLQLNFVCMVSEEGFRVNPQEHSEGLWAMEEELAGLEMTEEMRVVVGGAFRWRV